MLSCVGVHSGGLNVLLTSGVEKVPVKKILGEKCGISECSWQRSTDSMGKEFQTHLKASCKCSFIFLVLFTAMS